jgi:hypothetical protein
MENSSSNSARRLINETRLKREVFRSAQEADRRSAGSVATAARVLDQERYQAVPAATAPVARA